MQRASQKAVLTYTVSLKDSSGNAVTVPAGSSVAGCSELERCGNSRCRYQRLASECDSQWRYQQHQLTVTATDDYLKEGSGIL